MVHRPEDIDARIRQEAIRLAARYGNNDIVDQLLLYFEDNLDMKDLRTIRPLKISRNNPNAAEDIVLFYIGHVGDLRKLKVKRKGNNAETRFIKSHAKVFHNSDDEDDDNNNNNHSPIIKKKAAKKVQHKKRGTTSKNTKKKKATSESLESNNNVNSPFNPYNPNHYLPTKNGPNREPEIPVYHNKNIKHIVIHNKTQKKKTTGPQYKVMKKNKSFKNILDHLKENNHAANPIVYP